MSLHVEIPNWVKPPLSLNDRPRHWASRNDVVQSARTTAALLARSAINQGELAIGQPIIVTLIWYTSTRTRRDVDNPVATLKPMCDGLVDAGLVPDDTPEWMHKRPVRIEYRKGNPGVALLIETREEVVERAARALAEWADIRSPSSELVADSPEVAEAVRVVLDAAGAW